MKRLLTIATLTVGLLSSPAALAGEKTVTLAVQNMSCATCPYTVKASLLAVPGVAKVAVSFEQKTAIVEYDDAKTNIKALTSATTNAGYPSTPRT